MRERGGLREIELRGLTADETVELAELAADRPLDPAERSTLFEETDGHPLLVVELSRSGLPADASDLRRASPLPEALRSHGPGHLLPARMRAVIAARLDQLTPDARRLVELAAAFGRDFAFDALAAASDLDEPAVVTALDELWQRRLVRERGLGTYDLSHDRIRDVAYGETPPARRRILHRRIAQALELLHGPDLDPVAGQIAAHLEAAGQTRRAAELYERAAEVAGRVSAFAEVMRSLDRALALLGLESPSRARDERELACCSGARRRSTPSRATHRPDRRPRSFGPASWPSRSIVPVTSRWPSMARLGVAVVGGRIGEAIEMGKLGREATEPSRRRIRARMPRSAALESRVGDLEGADCDLPGRTRALSPGTLAAADACRRGSRGLCVCVGSPRAVAEWQDGRSARVVRGGHPAGRRARPSVRDDDRPSYAAILSQLRDDISALKEHAEAAAELCARYDFAYYAEWPTILRAWADRETADDSAERIERADRQDGRASGVPSAALLPVASGGRPSGRRPTRRRPRHARGGTRGRQHERRALVDRRRSTA